MPADPTSSTHPVDLHLLTILKQMVADMAEPDAHYMVSASYIDFVDSTRLHSRRYMCPIYIHPDSADNFDFDEQGILLDTFFSPRRERSPNGFGFRMTRYIGSPRVQPVGYLWTRIRSIRIPQSLKCHPSSSHAPPHRKI
ncbi:hypothetical protein GO730_39010 [Spirosoma sp. HMF3257]|uniref:hypothetical protein n=1 Tax=Spirosoma telluris TaxID=2183553 RepID=UPI0011B94149|nr:hypothetical protein [Spirosoma telluris]